VSNFDFEVRHTLKIYGMMSATQTPRAIVPVFSSVYLTYRFWKHKGLDTPVQIYLTLDWIVSQNSRFSLRFSAAQINLSLGFVFSTTKNSEVKRIDFWSLKFLSNGSDENIFHESSDENINNCEIYVYVICLWRRTPYDHIFLIRMLYRK